MSNIAYDPIKDRLARLIGKSRLKRRIFYLFLDMMFLRSWYVRKIIKSIATRLDKQGNWALLDAGCGFGQYERFVLGSFKNVKLTAVDIKDEYLKACSLFFDKEVKSKRVGFAKVNLYQVPYTEAFDVAICIDVLEHIEDDRNVIANLAKALKRGGYFLLHSPASREHHSHQEQEIAVGEHFREGYTKSDISEKMEQAGIEPVDIGFSYGKAGHLAWIIGIRFPVMIMHKLKGLGILLLTPYYPLVLPLFLLLNWVDTTGKLKKGRGIYALGRKR